MATKTICDNKGCGNEVKHEDSIKMTYMKKVQSRASLGSYVLSPQSVDFCSYHCAKEFIERNLMP